MTDKERKMALKRLRAENQELKRENENLKAAWGAITKITKWVRYESKGEVHGIIHNVYSERGFETLQRLAGITVDVETAEDDGKV